MRPVLLLVLPTLLGAAELHAQAEPGRPAADTTDVEPAVLEGTILSSAVPVAESAGAAADPAGTDTGAAGEAAGTPLPGAEVWILGTAVGTLADGEGRFRLAGLPPGRYRLLVGARGHREAVVAVEVAAGETGRVRVGLERRETDLERRAAALREKAGSKKARGGMAGFHERMASGYGEYVTRAEIELADSDRLSDVIQRYTSAVVRPCSDAGDRLRVRCWWVVTGTRLRLPGGGAGGAARTAGGGGGDPASRLRPRGSSDGPAGEPCVADVYLDGLPVGQRTHPDGIDAFPPSQLEAIEIYRRGALAPPEFRSVGGCGVVILWGRRPGGGGAG